MLICSYLQLALPCTTNSYDVAPTAVDSFILCVSLKIIFNFEPEYTVITIVVCYSRGVCHKGFHYIAFTHIDLVLYSYIPFWHVPQPAHFPSHMHGCANEGFHNMTLNMASWHPTHVDPEQQQQQQQQQQIKTVTTTMIK